MKSKQPKTSHPQIQLTNVGDVESSHDANSPWSEVLISDGRNRVSLISGPPGTPPDPHIHPDYNEWWLNIGGITQWQVGQYEKLQAEFGDVVIAPAGYSHDIRPKGKTNALRLAVSSPNSNHDIRGVSPARWVPIDYNLKPPNLIHTKLNSLIETNQCELHWSQIVVSDNRNTAEIVKFGKTKTKITRRPISDEWWVILKGKLNLRTLEDRYQDRYSLDLTEKDIVLIESGTLYCIGEFNQSSAIAISVRAPDSSESILCPDFRTSNL